MKNIKFQYTNTAENHRHNNNRKFTNLLPADSIQIFVWNMNRWLLFAVASKWKWNQSPLLNPCNIRYNKIILLYLSFWVPDWKLPDLEQCNQVFDIKVNFKVTLYISSTKQICRHNALRTPYCKYNQIFYRTIE